MRKHPLLAFATATISLSLGALQHGATGATTSPDQRGAQSSVTPIRAELASFIAAKRHRVTRHARRRHLDPAQRRHLVHLVRLARQLQASQVALLSRQRAEAGGVWAQLRSCESSANYGENSGNGYYGAYQFSLSSWRLVGYSGLPNQAAPFVQDAAARALQARQGWYAWPHCSATLGLT